MERKSVTRHRPRPWAIGTLLLATGTASVPATADDDLAPSVAHGTLSVRVTGFESGKGRLAIALFDSEQGYETQTDAARKAWLEIGDDKESVWRVHDLPEGEYALIAYHDENGNGEIDMRVLGMPKEPVAVSNDARGVFGPPRFKAAKFRFDAPLTRHDLRLR
ncbi:MAG: DUF2141 domain-containing protein [Gammaproteobacteria bacterium]|nr:DUF2141 domain-containing protein [Gammaproteobacteria bacterium]